MNSLIFDVMVRGLKPILWAVAFWLFMRGHNAPGGGFISGLIASSAVILQILSGGWLSINKRLRENLFELAGVGLGIAILSASLSFFQGNPFMTGSWITLFGQDLGTPVMFDLGVFVVVFAVVIICAGFLLKEEAEEEEIQE